MKKTLTIFGVSLLLGLAACESGHDNSVASRIENAQDALAQNDFKRSSEICNDLLASKDTAQLSASDYISLAVVYSVLADKDVNNDESMAQAAHCLGKAMEISPDSALVLFNRLSPDAQSLLSTAQQLLNSRGADMSRFIDPEDSLLISDHDLDPEANLTDGSHE